MKKMLIDDTQPEETRVVIVDGNKVEDVEFESSFRKQLKGNVFVAKVIRIEPSLQAAFVDYGGNRHGFLAFGEIHPDYYNVSDEVYNEIKAEVDEIIEHKRAYQLERRAEQERRRLEREQKRAEYEARRALELSQAEENIKNSDDNEDNTNTTCGCDENCACRKEDGLCHCHEEGVCTCDSSCECCHHIEENKDETSSDETYQNTPDTSDENTEETSSVIEFTTSSYSEEENQETVNKNEEETVCEDTAEENEETDETDETDIVSFADVPDDDEYLEEDSFENEEESKNHNRKRNSKRYPYRRGARFLGRRPMKGKYKVSTEASGLAPEMVAEIINEEDMEDEENENLAMSNHEENLNSSENLYDNDNDNDADADDDLEHYLEVQRKLIFARKLYHRSTIQDVIKEGQTLLIQIVKEERGNKGAACTTYLSLAGRYCVLMPNRIKSGGISRKITSPGDRKRLKDIMHELPLCDEMSLIIRTAGEDKNRSDIIRDYNYLIRTWNHIRHSAIKSNVPALIYEEGNLIKRALRDMYTKDIEEVIIDGDQAYKTAKDFSKILSPNMGRKIKCRKPNELPVFQRYQVEKELDKLHNPIVQLSSGGYLVINPTEALVSIDVNSGRATHEMDIEETALKTNLEAADEIAKQLRMRNLAGLVVVDFIDMAEPANNRAVEKRMKEAMKPDRARIQIAKMSIFGLLEISRQRMHSSFIESNYTTCPYCHGQGVQRTTESSATLVLRALEEEATKGTNNHFEAKLPHDIATYLLNHKRRILSDLEEKYEVEIIVSADSSIKTINDYKIEKTRIVKAKVEALPVTSAYSEECTSSQEDDEDNYVEEEETTEETSALEENRRKNNRRFHHRKAKNNRHDKKHNRTNSEPKASNDEIKEVKSTPKEEEKAEEKKTWWKKLIG